MSKFFIFLLFSVSTYSSCQKNEFTDYIKEFYNYSDSLKIHDLKSYDRVFKVNNRYKSIPLKFSSKFIIQDSLVSKNSFFKYYYGILINNSNNKIITTLVSKIQTKVLKGCDYDLVQLLIITYDRRGKIIDSRIVGKDNDCWTSETNFIGNKIEVQQIRLFNETKNGIRSELERITYQVENSGKIVEILKSPIKEIYMYYNQKENKYKVKQ